MIHTPTRLGLFGFGQFGQLAAQHLAPHFDVYVTDTTNRNEIATRMGVRWGTLADIAACDIVVLAVPVAALRRVLHEIAPLLAPGTLVLDVCSVKLNPAAWMEELLPADVDIVATHPLFGPQSAKDGLTGLKMMLCPVRGERLHSVAAFCERLGLQVIETTAEAHDREMSYVQALTHLIGRALVNMHIPQETMATQSYRNLRELCRLIGDDTWELFQALQTENPFAGEVTARFNDEVRALLAKVSER